jgi:hypothetical protein
MSDNLKIWQSVDKTDPKYTKDNSQSGRSSTSINTVYMIKQATSALGPIGEGWGYDIVEDRFDNTRPIVINGEPLTVDGSAIWEQVHTLKLRLWHGVRENYLEEYGHTPYRYMTKKGAIMVDDEYAKKSLSDAIKKSLSLLGVCADIYMGEFDNFEYKNERMAESQAVIASKKAETQINEISVIRDKLSSSISLMKTAKTWNEAEKIYGGAVSELSIKGPVLGMVIEDERKEIDACYFETKARFEK